MTSPEFFFTDGPVDAEDLNVEIMQRIYDLRDLLELRAGSYEGVLDLLDGLRADVDAVTGNVGEDTANSGDTVWETLVAIRARAVEIRDELLEAIAVLDSTALAERVTNLELSVGDNASQNLDDLWGQVNALNLKDAELQTQISGLEGGNYDDTGLRGLIDGLDASINNIGNTQGGPVTGYASHQAAIIAALANAAAALTAATTASGTANAALTLAQGLDTRVGALEADTGGGDGEVPPEVAGDILELQNRALEASNHLADLEARESLLGKGYTCLKQETLTGLQRNGVLTKIAFAGVDNSMQGRWPMSSAVPILECRPDGSVLFEQAGTYLLRFEVEMLRSALKGGMIQLSLGWSNSSQTQHVAGYTRIGTAIEDIAYFEGAEGIRVVATVEQTLNVGADQNPGTLAVAVYALARCWGGDFSQGVPVTVEGAARLHVTRLSAPVQPAVVDPPELPLAISVPAANGNVPVGAFTVSGTGKKNEPIALSLDVKNGELWDSVFTGQLTIPTNGLWEYPVEGQLADGEYRVQVAYPGHEVDGITHLFTVGEGAPVEQEPLAVTFPAVNEVVPYADTVTFYGTGPVDTQINWTLVFEPGVYDSTFGSGDFMTDAAGVWQVVVDGSMISDGGNFAFSVFFLENEQDGIARRFSVTAARRPLITYPNSFQVGTPDPKFTGTSDFGAAIAVRLLQGETVVVDAEVTANGAGEWEYSPTLLAAGEYTLSVNYADNTGIFSQTSFLYDPAFDETKLTITNPAPGTAPNGGLLPTFTGGVVAGQEVFVDLTLLDGTGGAQNGPATVDGTSWSYVCNPLTQDATYRLRVTDSSGHAAQADFYASEVF